MTCLHVSMATAFNAVHQIFDHFDQWEERLEQIIMRHGTIQDLLNTAHELLQNEWNDSLGSNLISTAVDVDYEIQDAQDVKGDELKSLKEEYKEAGVRVSAAKNVSVKFTITALGFSQDTVENIPLIKIRGSWYLDVESLGML